MTRNQYSNIFCQKRDTCHLSWKYEFSWAKLQLRIAQIKQGRFPKGTLFFEKTLTHWIETALKQYLKGDVKTDLAQVAFWPTCLTRKEEKKIRWTLLWNMTSTLDESTSLQRDESHDLTGEIYISDANWSTSARRSYRHHSQHSHSEK